MDLDTYDNPDAEALIGIAAERLSGSNRREIATQLTAAAGFTAAAVAIAVFAHWGRRLSVVDLGAVIAVWYLIERVKFPVAGGYTFPTMLAFVPALFILPTPIVPLVAMVTISAQVLTGILSGRLRVRMLAVGVADRWFTIGPVLVIVLAHAQHFAWDRWAVYVAALGAEILFDTAATIARCWFGERIHPRVQLPLLTWNYVSDITLAPLGLVIAAVSYNRPLLVLVALAPTANLLLFARERKQRMDETLALSTAYRGTALLLGDIVEADDHYTGMHSRDVVDLTMAVSRELGLDGTQRRNAEFAALLHDVGKIRIPKEIINKTGPLDDDEWAIVRRHTIDGEQMLQMVGGALARVGRIVRGTHERFDGRGYPDGLTGESIPIEARIISACDAYSAMTTDRPYRSAMSPQEALTELRRCSDAQFDPKVVAAIESLITSAHGSWLDLLAGPEPPAHPVAVSRASSGPGEWSQHDRPGAHGHLSKIQSKPPQDSSLVSI